MNDIAPTLAAPYSPTIWHRLKNLANRARYALQQILLRAAIGLSEESGLKSHAQRELVAAGYKLDDKEEGPNKWIQQDVLDLLAVFAMQGHSGSSAPYCVDVFAKLAKYEPLVPLSGDESEWFDHGDGHCQNKRCGHVFKQPDRFNGQAYDIEAVIFWEWFERPLEPDEEGYPGTYKGKTHFTSRDSMQPITFPYTPKREYRERPAAPVAP